MFVMRVNSQKKAERIVHGNRGKRRMNWQKYYSTDREGRTRTEYLLFYYPIGRSAATW